MRITFKMMWFIVMMILFVSSTFGVLDLAEINTEKNRDKIIEDNSEDLYKWRLCEEAGSELEIYECRRNFDVHAYESEDDYINQQLKHALIDRQVSYVMILIIIMATIMYFTYPPESVGKMGFNIGLPKPKIDRVSLLKSDLSRLESRVEQQFRYHVDNLHQAKDDLITYIDKKIDIKEVEVKERSEKPSVLVNNTTLKAPLSKFIVEYATYAKQGLGCVNDGCTNTIDMTFTRPAHRVYACPECFEPIYSNHAKENPWKLYHEETYIFYRHTKEGMIYCLVGGY